MICRIRDYAYRHEGDKIESDVYFCSSFMFSVNTLSQDIIVSESFSDGIFGVFSWSVNEVLRKNREAILVDIIVESSQRNLYIHSFIDENLTGGIDG